MRTRLGFIVALFAVLCAVGRANAQGVPNWTGFYVGGTAGYGWGHSSQTDNLPPPAAAPLFDCGDGIFAPTSSDCPGHGSHAVSGGLAGAAIGYNWQYGAWIAGIEGGYSYAAIGGHSESCGSVPHECGAKLKSLGTVRGRVGYAMNQWLPFVSGGWAFGKLHGYDTFTATSGSKTRDGWTLGGGVETRIAENWSVKLEYLYVDLGKGEVFDIRPGFPESVSFKANIVNIGLNYKLN